MSKNSERFAKAVTAEALSGRLLLRDAGKLLGVQPAKIRQFASSWHMMYLLDSNTLIEAKNRYYGMTICPGYWSWVLRSHRQGAVASIETVGHELQRGNDELAQWAKHHKALFLTVSDEATQTAFAEVAAYVASQTAQMKAGALEEF